MKSKRIYLIASILLVGFTVGIAFQNCAPNKFTSLKPSSALNSSSLSSVASIAANNNNTANNNVPAVQQVYVAPTPAVAPEATAPTVPQAAFGGGGGATTPTPSIIYTPTQPQAPNPYTGNVLSNSGLSYQDAINLRKKILGLYDAEVVFPKTRPAFMISSAPVPASNIYR